MLARLRSWTDLARAWRAPLAALTLLSALAALGAAIYRDQTAQALILHAMDPAPRRVSDLALAQAQLHATALETRAGGPSAALRQRYEAFVAGIAALQDVEELPLLAALPRFRTTLDRLLAFQARIDDRLGRSLDLPAAIATEMPPDAVEEMLLKGATHNITVRTRPEVALYVLNQKRAHLRTLEERFRISITVNADATINGQMAFVIDRGEQVMTAEQARALAVQAQAALVRPDAGDDETAAADINGGADNEEPIEGQPQSYDSSLGLQDGAHREGGRRRRRRRRRGRGGIDRDQAAHTPEMAAETAVEPSHWAAADTEQDAAPEEQEPERPQQQPQPAMGEAQGDGQRRRRRRGRRGGRRNRRDREISGEIAPAALQSEPLQPGAATGAAEETAGFGAASPETGPEGFTAAPPRAESASPAPAAASATAAAPPVEQAPAPENLTPAAPATPSEQSSPAPRRRSTVREPAPVAGIPGAEPPHPTSAPAVQIAVESLGPSAQDTEAERPRRTGWWARRFAADKG